MGLYGYCLNNPLTWIDPYGFSSGGPFGGGQGIRLRLLKGALAKLVSPIIDQLPACATRGFLKMVSGYGDVVLGIALFNIGLAIAPMAPTVVGGIASAALISAGATQIGLGTAFGTLGLIEFIQHGGPKGMLNEVYNFVKNKVFYRQNISQ